MQRKLKSIFIYYVLTPDESLYQIFGLSEPPLDHYFPCFVEILGCSIVIREMKFQSSLNSSKIVLLVRTY
jgi:hypothetical protein